MSIKIILISISFIICSLSAHSIAAQPDGIYRIKLFTVSNQSDLSIFNRLKDLGAVILEPYAGDKLRVYLGNYIGKATADRILPTVVSRGFSGAYVEKSTKSFIDDSGDSLTHTLQFIALKKLDIRTIVNNPKLSEPDKNELYIWYHNGFYRVSMGMTNEQKNESIEKYKAKTSGIGFESFTQKFAGVKPVTELPKSNPTSPKVIIPNAKKLEQKNSLEKELNKSTEPKTTLPKTTTDPILVPKEAKINPNAKLKSVKQ
jgi:hypothetical protein